MNRNIVLALAVSGALAGVLLRGRFELLESRSEPALAKAPRAAPGSSPQALQARRQMSDGAGHQWFDEVPSLVAMPAPRLPLLDQVARLDASHEPRNAYEAYRLIRDCVFFESTGIPHRLLGQDTSAAQLQEEAAFCKGMTARMKTARFDYLERAAAAGVDAAVADLLAEGPLGDTNAVRQRPDDPAVKEWQARTLALATARAEAGDETVLAILFTGSRGDFPTVPKDPLMEFTYGTAWRKISESFGPAVSFAGTSESELAPARALLTDAQVAAATARAAAIAAAFRKTYDSRRASDTGR